MAPVLFREASIRTNTGLARARHYARAMSALRAEEVEDGKGEGSGGVPCSGLRRELLDCLRESDCVKIVSVPRLISPVDLLV